MSIGFGSSGHSTLDVLGIDGPTTAKASPSLLQMGISVENQNTVEVSVMETGLSTKSMLASPMGASRMEGSGLKGMDRRLGEQRLTPFENGVVDDRKISQILNRECTKTGEIGLKEEVISSIPSAS